jgi:hypothetical protein
MGFQHFDLVERAAEELRREGKIQPRDHNEEVEQDKGRITRRAAYYAYQRDTNVGILEKTTGNNARGYSVDIIIAKNGEFWDIVTDDGREARPINADAKSDPGLSNRWRQPTRDLAELGPEEPEGNGTKPGSNGGGGQSETGDLGSKLDTLVDLTRQLIQKQEETAKALSDGLDRVAKEIRDKQIRFW